MVTLSHELCGHTAIVALDIKTQPEKFLRIPIKHQAHLFYTLMKIMSKEINCQTAKIENISHFQTSNCSDLSFYEET